MPSALSASPRGDHDFALRLQEAVDAACLAGQHTILVPDAWQDVRGGAKQAKQGKPPNAAPASDEAAPPYSAFGKGSRSTLEDTIPGRSE